jgi:hypothetical protein
LKESKRFFAGLAVLTKKCKVDSFRHKIFPGDTPYPNSSKKLISFGGSFKEKAE